MKKAIGILITITLVFAVGGAGYFFIWPMLTEEKVKEDPNAVYVTDVNEIVNGFGFTANRYNGIVETQEIVKVDADADKKIKNTFVKEGDIVKSGDKLFEYDIDEMKIQLDQDKLSIAQTESQIKGYNDQIEALEKEKKNVSANKQITYNNQIEGFKLEVKKLEYTKESLEKDIKKLEKSIDNAVVKSSVSGTVQTVDDPTGTSYVTIASNGDLRIKATVAEDDIPMIYDNEPILIRSRLNDNITWSGRVTSIDTAKPMINTNDYTGETTTRYPIYISIDDVDGLLIGQHVTVEEKIEDGSKPGLWLDEGYILDADSNPYVWAKSEDGLIEKRYVELGEHDEEQAKYEIKSGLTNDDSIAYPETRISEGMTAVYNISPSVYSAFDDVGIMDDMMMDDMEME